MNNDQSDKDRVRPKNDQKDWTHYNNSFKGEAAMMLHS